VKEGRRPLQGGSEEGKVTGSRLRGRTSAVEDLPRLRPTLNLANRAVSSTPTSPPAPPSVPLPSFPLGLVQFGYYPSSSGLTDSGSLTTPPCAPSVPLPSFPLGLVQLGSYPSPSGLIDPVSRPPPQHTHLHRSARARAHTHTHTHTRESYRRKPCACSRRGTCIENPPSAP
jgi:hypothetical protein